MLDNISKVFGSIFKTITGNSHITENNIRKALADVRISLLEADVNVAVVRKFINEVTESALGEKVLTGVNAGQQFIKIFYDKLVEILGDKTADLKLKPDDTTTVIMLAGLQGSGKTTTAGKLAYYLKNEKNKKVLLVACDVYRPAAIEQLEKVAELSGAGIYTGDRKNPIKIAKEAIKYAKQNSYNTIIVDTAGRLHIDKEMMSEAQKIANEIKPDELLFVSDSMTGQSAVEVAKEFDKTLAITGVILTKFDSDTRGGAAFSIKTVLGKPIKFIGVSEKIDGLELFHPDRIASRILGMGDVVSLVEKAEKVYEEEEAKKLEQKIRKEEFTLQDFLEQLEQVSKMGSLESLLEMIPGVKNNMQNININDKEIKRQKAIIQSMTKKERLDHRLIVGSRKRRIAKGAGVSILEVEKLLKKFLKSRQMMKNMLKNTNKYSSMLDNVGGMFTH